ncbi:NADP-dependent oxidoreductase [Streptomyces sp. NPDC052727]|uniref:NADP-dependent oxidoreductase n=1 Tax=unclassified Streptomyces TaxID=2593676 RepID=UPI00341262C2
MLAISQREFGGPGVLAVVSADRPAPGFNEILVRVHAAGVNPVDWRTRADGGLGTLGSPPFVLGWDVSGTVESVGVGVTLFRPGDTVIGMPGFPHPAGAYAEFVAGPARHFVQAPDRLGHRESAALPLAGLTAWQALTDTANLRSGQHVLVHGAAGGVGHLAVQIAKALGAKVTGTARQSQHGGLVALGADDVIDYVSEDFTDSVRDVDVVIDTVGGDCALRSLSVLRPGGILVTLPGPPEDALVRHAAEQDKRAVFMLVEPDRQGLLALTELVGEGRLAPVVDTVLPLAEAAKAHELAETAPKFGKIVLDVAGGA